MQRYYGVALSDLTTGALSWRRLEVLVAHLPTDSATHRSVFGAAAAWSATEHLLANVVDLLAGANWQRGGGRGSRPKPLRRPGMGDQRREKHYGGTTVTLDEARRRVEHRRRRRPHDH